MTIFYLLIIMSIVFLLLAAAAFIWSVNHQQMDDLEPAGQHIFFDEPPQDFKPNKPALKTKPPVKPNTSGVKHHD